MNIEINASTVAELGTYTVYFLVWDGGFTWATRDNNISGPALPSFTLHIRDAGACTSGAITPTVSVAEDVVNSGWDYVYTIGDPTLVITWVYTGDC